MVLKNFSPKKNFSPIRILIGYIFMGYNVLLFQGAKFFSLRGNFAIDEDLYGEIFIGVTRRNIFPIFLLITGGGEKKITDFLAKSQLLIFVSHIFIHRFLYFIHRFLIYTQKCKSCGKVKI